MPSALTLAHIEAERRLRLIVTNAVGNIWNGLPGYDRANMDEWLSKVLPVVEAGQRRSVALTDAYLARYLGETPKGVDPEQSIGAAVRNGTEPVVVYERPLIKVWTALKNGAAPPDAIAAGLAQAKGSAAMDVQLAMRSTLMAVANG
jgi:hypothetical protein